jgi:hypothetical protein
MEENVMIFGNHSLLSLVKYIQFEREILIFPFGDVAPRRFFHKGF